MRLWRDGKRLVVGVDEVGMGALCAPVFAAAVLVRPHTRKIAGVRDSKTLSAQQRDRVVDEIKRRSLAWGVGAASVAEIERLNIRNATHLAMRRALRASAGYDHVLVDGLQDPWLRGAHRAVHRDRRRRRFAPTPSPAPRSSPRSRATGSWPGWRCAIPATAGSTTPATPRATTWPAFVSSASRGSIDDATSASAPSSRATSWRFDLIDGPVDVVRVAESGPG